MGTERGLYWVDPAGAPKFTAFAPGDAPETRRIRVLLEDRSGTLWCGTRRGLFQFAENRGRPAFKEIDIGLPRTSPESAAVTTLLEDRRGALWIGGPSGL